MPLQSPRFAGNDRLQRAANNNPPLQFGETGEAVRLLQKSLIECAALVPQPALRFRRLFG